MREQHHGTLQMTLRFPNQRSTSGSFPQLTMAATQALTAAEEKHHNRAQQIGVNAFLGKPYQDTELLAQLAQYVPHHDHAGNQRIAVAA